MNEIIAILFLSFMYWILKSLKERKGALGGLQVPMYEKFNNNRFEIFQFKRIKNGTNLEAVEINAKELAKEIRKVTALTQ